MVISNICKNDKKLMFRMFKQYPEFFLNIAKSMIDVKAEMIDYALNIMIIGTTDLHHLATLWMQTHTLKKLKSDVMEHAIADFEDELEHYDFQSFKESLGGM